MITALPKRSGTEPRAVASGLKTQPAVLTEGAIAADRDTEQVQISTRVLVLLVALAFPLSTAVRSADSSSPSPEIKMTSARVVKCL